MARGAPKGHPRWGGKKRGTKNKATLEREAAINAYQNKVFEEFFDVIRAQLDQAKGISVMFQRKKVKNKKTGKFERTGDLVRVRDLNRIEDLLKNGCQGEDYYYITAKDPNVKAIDDVLNRALGKPKESMDMNLTADKPVDVLKLIRKSIHKIKNGNQTRK